MPLAFEIFGHLLEGSSSGYDFGYGVFTNIFLLYKFLITLIRLSTDISGFVLPMLYTSPGLPNAKTLINLFNPSVI